MAAGDGVVDGMNASFQGYRSSDEVDVVLWTNVLSSPQSAAKEYENRVQNAKKIIEKGIKIDRDGNVVGERAVLIFPDRSNTDKEMVAVLWTRKTDLLVVETLSMKHALAFEKKYLH